MRRHVLALGSRERKECPSGCAEWECDQKGSSARPCQADGVTCVLVKEK